jgi:hypothetical protein
MARDPCPKTLPPAVQPKEVTPAAQPKEVTPAVQPKEVTPAVQPKEVTPAVQPKEVTPAVQCKEVTPAAQPKVFIYLFKHLVPFHEENMLPLYDLYLFFVLNLTKLASYSATDQKLY